MTFTPPHGATWADLRAMVENGRELWGIPTPSAAEMTQAELTDLADEIRTARDELLAEPAPLSKMQCEPLEPVNAPS